ncbi:MAG: bacillithiol biosynthesis deacetylase BshB1 [Microscillaceae bacterium]|jgi:bacillithiol biosynthesis deacetylase BshB1|nr:bacillithiol biosynthesis deacetylase BshB1 [Microscillaceae bacterium]
MKLDILAMCAHPDDAELSCSGTIALHVALGKKVGLLDFTRGELGTRGTPETRQAEAEASSKILGLVARENLGLADGFFKNDAESQLQVIRKIRQFQPEIVLANAINDRHIDHGRASQLAKDACFLSGLRKIVTYDDQGQIQAPWRPRQVYHYIQDRYLEPDLIVDISPYWQIKMESVRAFKTQFFVGEATDNEPSTPISTPDFIYFLEARAREFGRMIGVEFGEGFVKATPPGVKNLFDLI